MELDLSGITIVGLATLLIIAGAIDVVGSQLIALSAGNWSSAYALNFIVSHVAKVWFPILALAVIGNGIEALGVPKIELATLAATGSLALYVLVTIASLKQSFDDRGAVPS